MPKNEGRLEFEKFRFRVQCVAPIAKEIILRPTQLIKHIITGATWTAPTHLVRDWGLLAFKNSTGIDRLRPIAALADPSNCNMSTDVEEQRQS